MAKERTELQRKAQTRNHSIMILRGMWAQTARLDYHYKKLSENCEAIRNNIDDCLKLLEAESQSERLQRIREETWGQLK